MENGGQLVSNLKDELQNNRVHYIEKRIYLLMKKSSEVAGCGQE